MKLYSIKYLNDVDELGTAYVQAASFSRAVALLLQDRGLSDDRIYLVRVLSDSVLRESNVKGARSAS